MFDSISSSRFCSKHARLSRSQRPIKGFGKDVTVARPKLNLEIVGYIETQMLAVTKALCTFFTVCVLLLFNLFWMPRHAKLISGHVAMDFLHTCPANSCLLIWTASHFHLYPPPPPPPLLGIVNAGARLFNLFRPFSSSIFPCYDPSI